MKFLFEGRILSVARFVLTACSVVLSSAAISATLPDVDGDAAAGEATAAVCSACHGPNGNSLVGSFPKLAAQSSKYTELQLHLIKTKERDVPQMYGITDGLSDQDMADLAAYYQAQKISPGAAKPEGIEVGEQLFRAGNPAKGIPSCTGCHGPVGQGNIPGGFPHLAGQHADYIKKQLSEYRSGERAAGSHASMMQGVAANLNDKEIAALANYIQGLSAE